ncbi:hypothetical protein [Desulforhopalus sp. IMCC35007]|uniref:hypothetical protein n=1 Tax=Desulforhopalus sp. IMCC35007 TaxID=2569543 RepID=UPI00197AE301|nr:hypothetical protein [Desulforhopalus sp. IMCC35007]
MKTTRLFIIVFFIMSTWVYAADPEVLSVQQQENVRQISREMKAQGIDEEQAEKMFRLMYQNRYQERNIIRAKQTVLNTVNEELPTLPVMNKAVEGIVKQVPQEKVVAAMETVRHRYSHAYRLTRSLSSDKKANASIADAIADSLAAGISAEELDVIVARLRVQTRQKTRNHAEDLTLQTMLTVRTMARLGAHSTDISDTVCQALQNGYNVRQMEQLRHRFNEEAQNTPAKQLAHQYAGTIGKSGGVDGDGSGGSGSGGNGSGGNGSGGNGSGGNGSGGNGSGGNGSGGNGSGGNGSGGNGSGGNGSGGNGSGK